MFIDVVGTLLTIILVSLRYWWMVLTVSALEIMLSLLLSIAVKTNITEIIAGGVFTTMKFSEQKLFFQLFCPIFLFMLGLSLIDFRRVRWIDIINPISKFKKPWPVILIKTAFLKILVIIFFILK